MARLAKPDERDDKMARILEALDIRGLKATIHLAAYGAGGAAPASRACP